MIDDEENALPLDSEDSGFSLEGPDTEEETQISPPLEGQGLESKADVGAVLDLGWPANRQEDAASPPPESISYSEIGLSQVVYEEEVVQNVPINKYLKESISLPYSVSTHNSPQIKHINHFRLIPEADSEINEGMRLIGEIARLGGCN